MHIYKILLIICDTILVNLSMLVALLLKFEGNIPGTYMTVYLHTCLLLSLISLGTFALGRLYRSLWSYASIKELFQVSFCTTSSLVIFYCFTHLTSRQYPVSVYIIYDFLVFFCIGGLRLFYRIARRMRAFFPGLLFPDTCVSRVLLVGAGEAASLIIKEFAEHVSSEKIVAAVDDCPYKQHTMINSVRICGNTDVIPELVQKYNISKIIIAIPSASKERISKLVSLCNTTPCKLEIFPGIQKSLGSSVARQIRPVNIEDLLGRDEIILDNTPLYEQLSGKTVLVTGGGGSIGSELCRQVVRYHPDHLVIFDIYENNAYQLQNELLATGFEEDKLDVVIGSVRDIEKLEHVFKHFSPDIIFHAAAHKHVPLMESNPCEAIKNNVYGTLNAALCAKKYQAEKFILISTDKAVNPTNVMGASKRLCEMIIQGLAQTHCHTSFAAVRFGNVLGSSGSVIPLFKKQLEMGMDLTVTHEDIIRYFMTIPEAVRLILQAGLFAEGGEIFVLDMGEPVKIMDLAKNFIKLSGLTLGKDINIKITGLRPGEKLYEELLMNEEGLQKTACDKIFVGRPLTIDFELLQRALYRLKDYFYDEKALKMAIMKLVPTYHPNSFNESILTQKEKLSS